MGKPSTFRKTLLTDRIKERFKNRQEVPQTRSSPVSSIQEDTRSIEELSLPASAENLLTSMGELMKTAEDLRGWLQHPGALKDLLSPLSKETAAELERVLEKENLLLKKQ